MEKFVFQSPINTSKEEVFQWHQRPDAIRQLIPPWQKIEVLKPPADLKPGTRVKLRMHFGPFSKVWVAEHTEFEEGSHFTDEQKEGPFRSWTHTHRMIEKGAHQCLLSDEIEWELPGGKWVSRLFKPLVHSQLNKLFAYRHQVVQTHFIESGTAGSSLKGP